MKEIPSKTGQMQGLGPYLQNLRKSKNLSLRDVEEATDKEVSNAYLSQLENGKITRPSPNILFSLSEVYGVPYENLMERAGYVFHATSGKKSAGQKHGRAATFSIDNLTLDEEAELLKYLAFIRSKRGKSS